MRMQAAGVGRAQLPCVGVSALSGGPRMRAGRGGGEVLHGLHQRQLQQLLSLARTHCAAAPNPRCAAHDQLG